METGPTMSIQDEWYYNILELIPEKLKDKKEYREALKVLFDEVVTDFAKSMKKSMGKRICSCHYTIYLSILTFLTFLDHLLVQGRPVFLSSSIFDLVPCLQLVGTSSCLP